MCDEHMEENWWADKVNAKGGFVLVEAPVGVGEKSEPTVERQHIPTAWRVKLKAKRKEILASIARLNRKVVLVAIACCVPTTCVDIGSGDITGELGDVHEFPEAEDESKPGEL